MAATQCRIGWNFRSQRAVNKAKCLINGAPEEIRTPDPQIRSMISALIGHLLAYVTALISLT